MKRDISALGTKEYDLLIVGGGIFGACAAWDAASRGLSVALLEKADFCSATSANHFKMVHGGIRYLQHLDLYRIRESSLERAALLRIAPHLVRPLEIVIPTYSHGIKGKEILRAGFLFYETLTFDRNRGIKDPERHIPRGRFISREEVLRVFPGLRGERLTGGAVFYDGQIYNPPRLVLSFLKSANHLGAVLANYVEVTGFVQRKDKIVGVLAKDVLNGDRIEVRGKTILNASGPWAHRLLEDKLSLRLNPRPVFSRDLALVLRKRMRKEYALTSIVKTKDADAILDRGGRHLFVVPWRGHALAGVWHRVYSKAPEEIRVTEKELKGFVEEINEGFPHLESDLSDISMINTGLTLFGNESKEGSAEMSFGKRSMLIDHYKSHKIKGLVTLIGVRATVARGMAKKVIDLVIRRLGERPRESRTEFIPIYGGDICHFKAFLSEALQRRPAGIHSEVMEALVHNYGCKYHEILDLCDENPEWVAPVQDSTVLKAEIIHAVREEMAQKLGDVIFRRTDLGTAGNPGDEALKTCTNLMSNEAGWNRRRIREELEAVKARFQTLGFLRNEKKNS